MQCKGKDTNLGAEVTEAELRTEVEKAKGFTPQLASWILATTAPKDAPIEALARRITAEHQTLGLFSVQVLAWEDLQSMIASCTEVMEQHYPDQAPSRRQMQAQLGQLFEQGEIHTSLLESVGGRLDAFLASASRNAAQLTAIDVNDVALQAQIDQVRTLIVEGQPKTALRLLDRVIEKSWETATSRARFRLLSNRAAALVECNEAESAASLFIESAQHAPDDSKARVNLALGYLIRGETDAIKAEIGNILAVEPTNADAAAM